YGRHSNCSPGSGAPWTRRIRWDSAARRNLWPPRKGIAPGVNGSSWRTLMGKIFCHPLNDPVLRGIWQPVVIPRFIERKAVRRAVKRVNFSGLVNGIVDIRYVCIPIELWLHNQRRAGRDRRQQFVEIIWNLRLVPDEEAKLRYQPAFMTVARDSA